MRGAAEISHMHDPDDGVFGSAIRCLCAADRPRPRLRPRPRAKRDLHPYASKTASSGAPRHGTRKFAAEVIKASVRGHEHGMPATPHIRPRHRTASAWLTLALTAVGCSASPAPSSGRASGNVPASPAMVAAGGAVRNGNTAASAGSSAANNPTLLVDTSGCSSTPCVITATLVPRVNCGAPRSTSLRTARTRRIPVTRRSSSRGGNSARASIARSQRFMPAARTATSARAVSIAAVGLVTSTGPRSLWSQSARARRRSPCAPSAMSAAPRTRIAVCPRQDRSRSAASRASAQWSHRRADTQTNTQTVRHFFLLRHRFIHDLHTTIRAVRRTIALPT